MKSFPILVLSALLAVAIPAASPAAGEEEPVEQPEEWITVEFTEGSAEPSNIDKAKLDVVARDLLENPDLRALVIGHSASGGKGEDQGLSEKRALAVKNYLVTRHGIDPARITTEGRGAEEGSGNPAKDRRAVVILSVL